MRDSRWHQLSGSELEAFLGRGGTGVISFATGTDTGTAPPSIPVSYGYNADVEAFYFRLSLPPESRKAELVDCPVSFVTYGETDDGWKSAVATGRLEPVEEASYDSPTVQGMWGIKIPEVDVFEQPREELTFRDFQLAPETLSGRTEVPSEP
ncbi:flavin-nucleotide-binding protein-like protein [Natronococcus amylolyticus DSM 10524]|uniref:Flavin-nucleotide-binding protein-like protein n=1 Tax=Natronococcus amylolyticus DSM 10524 TaxID=1227497 RepID=L9WY88_9EURY|nr:pyridoxamine 5'-phosphate oxidase family protein [Natronococcus amylolyticus]ELY54430.1 flavin-nucleotide-binding protein-like protein [Natronococcus amylolyticus DSM 10524]